MQRARKSQSKVRQLIGTITSFTMTSLTLTSFIMTSLAMKSLAMTSVVEFDVQKDGVVLDEATGPREVLQSDEPGHAKGRVLRPRRAVEGTLDVDGRRVEDVGHVAAGPRAIALVDEGDGDRLSERPRDQLIVVTPAEAGVNRHVVALNCCNIII